MRKDNNKVIGFYLDKEYRLTKEQVEAETLDKIQAKYTAYVSGKISRTEWGDYIMLLLSAWIDYEYNDKKQKLGPDKWEDAKQSAYYAIMHNLDSYDPYFTTELNPKGTKPSAFFNKTILGAMREESNEGMDPNLKDIQIKLNRALASCIKPDGQRKYPDLLATPGLSVAEVYDIYRSKSGGKIIPLPKIKEVMEVLHRANTIQSIDALVGDEDAKAFEIPSAEDSPEETVIKNMQKEVIRNAFNILNPWEQYVVTMLLGLTTGHAANVTSLVKHINAHFDEYTAKYGEYEPIFRKEGCVTQMCQSALRSIYGEALKKMANEKQFLRFFPNAAVKRFMFDSRMEDGISYEDLAASPEFKLDIRSID